MIRKTTCSYYQEYPHVEVSRGHAVIKRKYCFYLDRITYMMLELETIKKTASPQSLTVAELENRNYQSLYLKIGGRLSRKQEEVPSKKGSFSARKKAFSNDQ
ncbi:uncharacterized protein LOC111110526 [Crassostrea virginica]